MVLWSSQPPLIFGFVERIGELLGYLPHPSDNPVSERLELIRRTIKRSEAGHRIRVVEVPGVLRQPHKVPDGRVGSPGATKRRTAQLLWNASAKERRDDGGPVNRLDRRQARQIYIRGRRVFGAAGGRRRVARLHWLSRLGSRVAGARLSLAARPTRKEFLVTHSCPPSRCRRASASRSARRRSRLTNSLSTWCSATKFSIASRSTSGIATASTRLAPASV